MVLFLGQRCGSLAVGAGVCEGFVRCRKIPGRMTLQSRLAVPVAVVEEAGGLDHLFTLLVPIFTAT